MTPAEIIREARALLFERGWYQGGLDGPDGSLCVLAAIERAAPFDQFVETARSLQAALNHQPIGLWNDSPDRVFSDIVDALDRAEKIAESREDAS